MNKYIIEILKNHSSLILPGIGALIVINKKTGEVKINPHLTFNDGALANFIADKEGIDKTEAQNQVSKFTREIKNQLDKGESYDIFEFGKIFKDDKNEVSFEMASKQDNSAKPVISDILKPKEAPTEKEVPKKEEKVAKPEVKPSAKTTSEKPPKKEAPKKEEKVTKTEAKPSTTTTSETTTKKEASTPVKNTYIPPKPTDVDKKEQQEDLPSVPKIAKSSTLQSAPAQTEAKSKVETTKETVKETVIVEKEKKRRWPIILIILLLLLILVAFLFKDKIYSFLGWNHQQTIVNVNHYPDADGDNIPDFADVDLTHGQDEDHDGIDDRADLDFTHGKDADQDGIDDTFAETALVAAVPEKIDITALKDENNNGIPDFAEVENTGGVDENGNGIDDTLEYDATKNIGTDHNENGLIDSLENFAILSQVNTYFEDTNNNGVPDFADVEFTQGNDINKNGIDDLFEKPENDLDRDGIDDALQMDQAIKYNALAHEQTPASTNSHEEIAVEESHTEEADAKQEDVAATNSHDETSPSTTEPEVAVEETIVEETSGPSIAATPSSTGNYHIVGGAFGEKANAENYVSQMSQSGFSPHIIGRFDGLYLVALNSYNSRAEANGALSSVRAQAKGAWVFKH